jgi:hypothetical protein
MPPAPVKKKRKTTDSDIEPESKAVKKQKASGSDLLKTLSPDSSEKKIFKEEESESEVKMLFIIAQEWPEKQELR